MSLGASRFELPSVREDECPASASSPQSFVAVE